MIVAGNRKTTEEERLILEHFRAAEGSDDEAANATRRRSSTSKAPADSARANSKDSARPSRVAMYEARESASADLFAARASIMAERELPLEQRDKDAAPQAAVQAHSSVRAAEDAAFVAMDAGYVGPSHTCAVTSPVL